MIQGKLEVTIKINTLPTDVTTDKNGWKSFSVTCDALRVAISLRPRMWAKLEEAAKAWPSWVAAISGTMSAQEVPFRGFVLAEPAVQVFERKPKSPPPGAAPEVPAAPAP